MTKSSPRRAEKRVSKKSMAYEAIRIASHGRLIKVPIDGKEVEFWAMPASAHQVVMSALRNLAK